jgi:tellurite resistance protein
MPDRTTKVSRVPVIPASFFGIVLGLFGLSNVWRAAAETWRYSPLWGETIGLVALVVWIIVGCLYALKWLIASDLARAEAEHPVQCCFIGLAGVATMLAAIYLHRYSIGAASTLFVIGSLFTICFALWRTGNLWHGGRDPATTTAVLYLPIVAGSYTTAMAASTLGFPDWGQLAFGGGFFSWLAIESVLLNRMLTTPEMTPALRPTLGIQLAPPAVGCAAYMSVTTGIPDIFSQAMLGYATLQALLLVRLLPWILKQPFSASYWSVTFGITAIATAAIRMVERGGTGAVSALAPALFILANVIVFGITVATAVLISKRELIPNQSKQIEPSPGR